MDSESSRTSWMSRSAKPSISPASHFDVSKACRTRSSHSTRGLAADGGLVPDRLEDRDAADPSLGQVVERRGVLQILADGAEGFFPEWGDLFFGLSP